MVARTDDGAKGRSDVTTQDPQGREAALTLLVWSAGARRFPLEDGTYVIGRGASVPIFVDDASLSRRHARLTVKGSRVTLEDLGSRNGIKVGGRKLDTE